MTSPPDAPIGAMLFTHGAGSDRDHPTALAVEAALAPLLVERVNFPYRKVRLKGPPDRAPKLIASVIEESQALAKKVDCELGDLVLAGRSLGGRMCSMAVAEGLPTRALVMIGYPLHPPYKPEKLRVEHFPALEVPCLFVSGTRDPFGTPEELLRHTAAIPGAVTHHWIEDGRHELKTHEAEIAATVKEWITGL